MGYYKEIRQIPVLSLEGELELAIRARAGDASARTELYEHNLRLVVEVARRYYRYRGRMDDLVEAGNTGLSRAIDKYDPYKGCKFSTYAVWWIRRAIGNSLYNEGTTIRIPVKMNETINRVLRGRWEYVQAHECDPTPAELASFLNRQVNDSPKGVNTAKKPHIYTPAEVGKILEYSRLRHVTSLDLPVTEGGNTLGELIADKVADPDEIIFKGGLIKKVQASIDRLTDQEKMVLNRRFGLNGTEPETLEKIGKDVGLTRERIRQIEAATLRKLRGHLQEVYESTLH